MMNEFLDKSRPAMPLNRYVFAGIFQGSCPRCGGFLVGKKDCECGQRIFWEKQEIHVWDKAGKEFYENART
ncbi:hypothetical protein [Oxalobacter formigenes]|uniref:hypothetical protein n=2 Tax=Oxalobacter formigenes TaxID=847 RepID=UPI0012F8B4F7|nr:hypothetical protein [Oxalobacter formigenes]WAW03536.1 hypothetical protein NB642_10465 [Oxalobacter formigenes]WAW06045.1 hypothetical protein NB639_01185 [Oxalobacter formigenes]